MPRSPTGDAPSRSKAVDYYHQTAAQYDQMHVSEGDEHYTAIERSWRLLADEGVSSVLDVGCGTGRGLEWFALNTSASLAGIDPSPDLLSRARARVPAADLREGIAQRLPFADASQDLVIATGIMHHVDEPRRCIDEMFRVARKAVLISDHNNLAFSRKLIRRGRLFLYSLGLLPAAMFVRNGFRKQGYTDDDGWWYHYSLLDDYGHFASRAARLLMFPTNAPHREGEDNFLLCQRHVAMLGYKTA